MNKKYLNSVLIILLIFIWGSVIYKYFGNRSVNIQDINIINVPSPFVKTNFSSFNKDDFELTLNDRDPFGVSKTRRLPALINPQKITSSEKKVEAKNVIWPNISYYGFVKGEKNNTRLVLIKINNKLSRKRETERINDVTIIKAFSDSVIVSFNKQLKTIKKINEKG